MYAPTQGLVILVKIIISNISTKLIQSIIIDNHETFLNVYYAGFLRSKTLVIVFKHVYFYIK